MTNTLSKNNQEEFQAFFDVTISPETPEQRDTTRIRNILKSKFGVNATNLQSFRLWEKYSESVVGADNLEWLSLPTSDKDLVEALANYTGLTPIEKE